MRAMQEQSHKVTSQHLSRKAVVYLRQSSLKQVRENLESQRLQYALVERARKLGWQDVLVLDGDLGSSASIGAKRRADFERLISQVALGEMGIVLSREVARLSRTDKDWCQLLEVCQIFDTLIGDEEQIYDLSLVDDQLVLGIKGTMSVVELKVLKMRMLQGQEEKARRGELIKRLPVGYVCDGAGGVVRDPDGRVREAIELVFKKFRELWTIRQTFKWFLDNEIELPVNKSVGGRMEVAWQLPSHTFISNLLHNPYYAGAYTYGRRVNETVFSKGRLVKRQGRIRYPEECRVFIRDHHEGYIDWETYEENQRMIEGNITKRGSDESVLAVRSGQGLLTGLLRCGRCGRKLHVRYRGRSGTAARYICDGEYLVGGSYCMAFGGALVDRRFSKELLEVISPLGIRASLDAIEELSQTDDERRRALKRQLEQLEYEARRAFEQYDEVDPRNRLVAAELEGRWNAKLYEVERVRTALSGLDQERRPLAKEEEEKILLLGERFSDVWDSENCPVELKKKIVRTVVEEVIVNEEDGGERLRFVIHWKGGSHTEFGMRRPRMARRTPPEALEVIRRMSLRYGDDQIAAVLNRQGHRTGKGKRWSQESVATVRRRHSIKGHRNTLPDGDLLSLNEAVRYCRVSDQTILRLVSSGIVSGEQVVPFGPWEIRRSDLDSEPVRNIIAHLHRTGKLVLDGGATANQETLFKE
jgi:DNA invertase Pin-like site-specific DNA recombinase